MRPSFTWPKPWPPSSGSRWAAHSPRSFTLLLQRRVDPVELRLAQLVDERLDRPDLLADERPHPLQLLLELRVRGEVPRHRAASFRSGTGGGGS